MALFLQSFGAPAILPAEAKAIQLEVQLTNLIFLVGIFLVLVVYIGFYGFIYLSTDCVRRSAKKKRIDPCGRRRYFQPFSTLNADPDDLQSTEWLGDWTSVSSVSADDELTDLL